MRARLFRALAATALGPSITIVAQVVLVPLLLRVWGVATYGQWIMLSSIVAYFSMSDLGFGSVAANDMAMQVAAGDKKAAIETFQSANLLILVISLITLAIALLLIAFSPLPGRLAVGGTSLATIKTTLFWFSVYAISTMQSTNVVGAFRSDGQYASGVTYVNCLRLIEMFIVLPFAAFGSSFSWIAFSLACCRASGTAAMIVVLRSRSSWLTFGLRQGKISRLREMLHPALAFTAFPLGNALSIQGLVLLVGLTLGPVAAASFSTLRTVTRVPFQLVEVIKNGLWPEFSVAFGTNNLELARRLHRRAVQLCLWMSIVGAVLIQVFGAALIKYWTHGRIAVEPRVLTLLLAGTVVSAIWNSSSVVLIAANMHKRIAWLYVSVTSMSLVIAFLLTPLLGVTAAALSGLFLNVVMSLYVLKESSYTLSDNAGDVLGSALNAVGAMRQAMLQINPRRS